VAPISPVSDPNTSTAQNYDDQMSELCDCAKPDGESQYKQLRTFFIRSLGPTYADLDIVQLARLYPLNKTSTMKKGHPPMNDSLYTYNISHKVIRLSDRPQAVVIITVVEFRSANLTQGGSGFQTFVQSSSTTEECPYKDFFNGTYVICCYIRENNSSINIELQHADFSMFKGYRPISKRHIWNRLLTNITYLSPIYAADDTCREKRFSGNASNGYWVKLQQKWNWVIDACVMPFFSYQQLYECTQHKYEGNVQLIGDSHIRYLFYYLVQMSDKQPHLIKRQNKTINMEDGNFTLAWADTIDTHRKALQAYVSRATGSSRLLILDNGPWEMMQRGYVNHIRRFDTIVTMLRNILEKLPNTSIVWQESPTLPEFVYNKDIGSGNFVQNNYMIMSMNYNACSQLKNIGVHCIPSFHMAYPWYTQLPERCGGTHILCRKNDYQVENFIGFSAVHYMLHTVCYQGQRIQTKN